MEAFADTLADGRMQTDALGRAVIEATNTQAVPSPPVTVVVMSVPHMTWRLGGDRIAWPTRCELAHQSAEVNPLDPRSVYVEGLSERATRRGALDWPARRCARCWAPLSVVRRAKGTPASRWSTFA